MKIRTDFVTNSSSSSFVVLHIKNKLLARIFEKYRGIVEDFFSPNREFYGNLKISADEISLEGGVPDCDMGSDVPKNAEDLAWCVASLLTYGNVTEEEQLDGGEFDESLEDLLRELFAQKKELSDALDKAYWEAGTQGFSPYDPSISRHFSYDPVNGPSYYEEENEAAIDEDWDE